MEHITDDKPLKPQNDGSTPFGQGQKGNTVTQDEQARMNLAQSQPPKRRSQREPTAKR